MSEDHDDDVGETRPHAIVSADTSARFRLMIEQGESRGVHVEIDGSVGPVLIGKSPICALRLDDQGDVQRCGHVDA